MSTPAQSKIEFTAHLIKISSQITVIMKESVAPVLFCVFIIYNLINNVVLIKYRTKNSTIKYFYADRY